MTRFGPCHSKHLSNFEPTAHSLRNEYLVMAGPLMILDPSRKFYYSSPQGAKLISSKDIGEVPIRKRLYGRLRLPPVRQQSGSGRS